MKKALKIAACVLVAAFAVLQFFQIDRSAPEIRANETLEASVNVPPDIELIFGRSCNDCHSNNTRYPWYSRIQPTAWFLKNHIDEGRQHLNLSTFATYTADRKKHKLEQICEQVKEQKMPLPSYLWIHRDAGLVDSERDAICAWTEDAIAQLNSQPAAGDVK